MNLPSRILIFTGAALLIFGAYLIFERYNPQRLGFNNAPISSSTPSAGVFPKEIIIADLDIKLPVYPAQIEKNKWEATTKGVSYLVTSPVPGEVGNSIIYGHNWANLLGRLPKIMPGQKIEIIFDNNEKRTFIVEHASIVGPDQTSILEGTSDKRITLYTCTGFLDSKRFVVTAINQQGSGLVDVEKAVLNP